MQHLEARNGSTYLRVKVLPDHVMFTPIQQFLRSRASVWQLDPRTRRWSISAEFYTYNPHSGVLRLPIGYLDCLRELGQEKGVVIHCTPDPIIEPRLIDISLKPGIKPKEHQLDPISFFSNPQGNYQRGLELQTGKGKTFIAIQSIVNLSCASMIVCSGLAEQWLQEIDGFTTCDNVYLIQTRRSLEKLFETDELPAIFVCSLGTMRLYSQNDEGYRDLKYTYPQFLAQYGIGIKVVDEVHTNVHAVAMLDLFASVRYNWYLSATFRRSSNDMRRIFNIIYPSKMKFGYRTYDRYVSLYYYTYVSGVPDRRTFTNRGYSQAKFEYHLLKTPTKLAKWINEVIATRIKIHYLDVRNTGEKVLIFVALLESVQSIAKGLKETFPALRINTYTGSDGDEKLDDVDVIVSVPKKCGTGTDISQLRTVINLVSTQSSEMIEQMLGRLRKLPNGVMPYFIQLYDRSVSAHVRHIQTHKEICCSKAVTWKEFEIR